MFICIHSETTGTVRKMGGNFKEKLREFGGLDAVIDIIRECHGVMEVVALSSNLGKLYVNRLDDSFEELIFWDAMCNEN